ncbi:hypothetical protein BROUX41_000682 [Berkeleyomyces rouxiae]|uniref:uncharacterized protein n=1 Tax=Berkeleyomyces rouxiae TaxID=2035830 RepID=UPI003B805F41
MSDTTSQSSSATPRENYSAPSSTVNGGFTTMRNEIAAPGVAVPGVVVPGVASPMLLPTLKCSLPELSHENYRTWLVLLNDTLRHNSLPLVAAKPGPQLTDDMAPKGVDDIGSHQHSEISVPRNNVD